jgi:uncharacterized membrane protein
MQHPHSVTPSEGILSFVLKNFATPIVFYITFKVGGAQDAIAFAVGVALLQALAHWVLGWKFSPYFLLSAGFTVLFGGADLVFNRSDPHIFRLEPFAQNFVIALLFIVSLFFTKSLIELLAESLPARVRPRFGPEDAGYLRKLTCVWAVYFVIKAFVFLDLAFRIDLGSLYVARVVIGNSSAVALLLGELYYRKNVRGRIR